MMQCMRAQVVRECSIELQEGCELTEFGQQGSNGAAWHILQEDVQGFICLLGTLHSCTDPFMQSCLFVHWVSGSR